MFYSNLWNSKEEKGFLLYCEKKKHKRYIWNYYVDLLVLFTGQVEAEPIDYSREGDAEQPQDMRQVLSPEIEEEHEHIND